MEPGMFMKIKQLSEESQHWIGPFKEIKYLKARRLSISVVGYQNAKR
jgi:hypothetical protein